MELSRYKETIADLRQQNADGDMSTEKMYEPLRRLSKAIWRFTGGEFEYGSTEDKSEIKKFALSFYHSFINKIRIQNAKKGKSVKFTQKLLVMVLCIYMSYTMLSKKVINPPGYVNMLL